MLRRITLIVLVLTFFAILIPFSSLADDTKDTAEEIITYEGLSARLASDSPGIRSIYSVNVAAVKALEDKGYTVAYGAVMGVGEFPDRDSVYDASSLAVIKNENGFEAINENATAICVYETKSNGNAPSYATDLYLSYSDTVAQFAFATVFSDAYQTRDFYADFGLCYAAFLSVTDANGVTAITYTRAIGDMFGGDGSVYGTATSLYEISDYFLNDYRVSDADNASPFSMNKNLRLVVSTSGISPDNVTLLNASYGSILPETETTEETYVFETNYGITFTANHATAGVYELYMSYNNQDARANCASGNLYLTANGRPYWGRLATDDNDATDATSTAADLAVAKDASIVGTRCFVMLDEGKNTVKLNVSESGMLGIGRIELRLVKAVTALDTVVNATEQLDTEKTTSAYTPQLSPSYTSQNSLIYAYNASLYMKVSIPADATYSLSLLGEFQPNYTVNVSFLNGSNMVAETSFVATEDMKWLDASRGLQYIGDCGNFDLPAGDYLLCIAAPKDMALSDIILSPVEIESKMSFTVLGTDLDGVDDALLAADNETVILDYGDRFSFTANIEVDGVYRLSGKTSLSGYIQYFRMDSNLQTAHSLISRLGVSGASTSETTAPVAENEKKAPYTDADCLGFIYLEAGTHTFTLYNDSAAANNAGDLGIYKLTLALETEQTDGSLYISARNSGISYSAETTVSKNQWKGNGDQFKGGGRLYVAFTATEDGVYDLYSNLSADAATSVSLAIAKLDAPDTAIYTATRAFEKSAFSWGQNIYAFGNCSNGVINTRIAEAITLTAGESYILTFDYVGADHRTFTFTDMRFVKRLSRSVYETLDLTPDKDDDGVYTTPILYIEKAGTTVYATFTGTRSGYFTGDAVVPYVYQNGVWVKNTADAAYLSASGYASSNDGRILAAAGRVTYKITTDKANTYLSFAGKANGSDAVTVSYVSDGAVYAVSGEIDTSNTVTLESVTFGAETSATVTVSGASNGMLMLLGYDRGESLVAAVATEKDEFTETYSLTLSGKDGAVIDSVRALLVSDIENLVSLSPIEILYRDETRFMLSAKDFSVDKGDLATLTPSKNAFVVNASAITPYGDASRLENRDVLLVNGSSNYATLTVTAPVSGMYKVDLKYNACGGFIRYFRVHNTTYAAWGNGNYGEGRFGKTGKPSEFDSDEDFATSLSDRFSAFDGTPEAYVYLVEGNNNLRFYFTHNVAAEVKLGISALRFEGPDYDTATANTVLSATQIKTANSSLVNILPTGTPSSSMTNNGVYLTSGAKVYFDVTIPEDGYYDVRMLGSTGGACVTVSTKSEESPFLPVSASLGEQTIGDSSTSTLDLSLVRLNLKAGKQTLCITVDSGQYFHFNVLAFYRIGEYDLASELLVSRQNAFVDTESGAFSFDVYVADTECRDMRIELLAYGKDENGEFSYSEIKERTDFESVTTFSGVARDGFESITLSVALYDASDNSPAFTCDDVTYTKEASLRVLFITDTHYTGTNLTQKIYDYNNGVWIEDKAVHSYNYSTKEDEIYNWTSDEQIQRVIDSLIARYQNGEFDMVFFLGDSSVNDGSYGLFETNNIRYQNALKNGSAVYSDPDGETCNGFWDHPLNVSAYLKAVYFDQLSEYGIPYYLANGNHDYQYTYNDDKSGLDFTPWEQMYHYAELFGHRTDKENGKYLRDENGEYIYYEDSDSANYLVRAIRRNGKVYIVSAMTEADLAAFKAKHANDTNCYDFYVSEETVGVGENANDINLGAFAMVNGFQVDSYDFYTDVGIYYDTVAGTYVYTGQTIRYDYLHTDLVRAILDASVEYPQTYLLAHYFSRIDITEILMEYPNIVGAYYGDVHDEEHYTVGNVPFWVVGNFAQSYDIDKYYDAEGNPDNQYYYMRGASAIGNTIWGDVMRHPWANMALSLHGSVSYTEREHMAFFYDNGVQKHLTKNRLTGMDVKYTRAVADASLYAAHETLYAVYEEGRTVLYRENDLPDSVTARKVFVGGDVYTEGSLYYTLGKSYTANKINAFSYHMDAMGNLYTTGGAYIGTVDAYTSLAEGAPVTVNGETYYITARGGEVRGHYLYDEKGDYVYVDEDGNLVFYEAKEKSADYIEASIQTYANDVDAARIPYERIWFYLNTDKEFVLLDKDGDGKLDAGEYTDMYIVTAEDLENGYAMSGDKHAISGLVSSPVIVVDENGIITKGEGFCSFTYAHDLVYADGSLADESSVLRETDENGNTVYGVYAPYMPYAGEWFGA